MSFLKGVKHIGEAAVSPFVHTASGIENVVSTAHHDAVGISKGVFSLAQDSVGYVGNSLEQITSPTGLIAIAAIIGGVALIGILISSMNSK